MRSRFAILVPSIVFSLLVCLPSSSVAEGEIDAEFRKAVQKLLEVQKTPEAVSEQLTYSIAQQTLGALASNGISITPPIQQIIVDVARDSFGHRFSEIGYLADLYAPIYAEHYSQKELDDLIAFWESPVGKKTIDVMPAMTERSYVVLERASAPFISEFHEAVDKRLGEAGIVLAPGTSAPEAPTLEAP